METVVPRVVPQGPSVSVPPPTAQISTPPPDLQRLEIGTKLDALVLQATSKGTAEISSSFGKLQITTNFPLPANAALQFQIIGKLPLLQLLITSVQGQSPQSFIRAALQDKASSVLTSQLGGQPAASTLPQAATSRLAPASLTLTVGANVIATKIGAGSLLSGSLTAPQAGVLATAPQISPLTGLQNPTPTSPAVPAQSGNASTSSAAALGATSTSAPGAQATTSPAGTGALNQTGSRFSVRIVELLPPSQLSSGGGLPSSGSSQFTMGQTVTGVVTSTNAQGHTFVQTHAGPVSLAAPNPLPPGTTLSFIINGPLPSSPAGPALGWANHNASVIMETHNWPQLDDALRSLGESHPTLAQQVINTLLPKGDTTLAANIILLLAAIRGGDIRNWFGDAPVRTLQRLRPDLMGRLRDDFVQMSRMADDTASNDWRAYPVPFLNGQEIEQIRFYTRRKPEDDGEGTDADPGARFVIDLDLTQLGRLQLDGLVKARKKQFDLIVRTDDHLQVALQNNIRTIFQNAMALTNNNGGLTFQAAPADFLDIQTYPTSTSDSGLIV